MMKSKIIYKHSAYEFLREINENIQQDILESSSVITKEMQGFSDMRFNKENVSI